MPLFSRYIGIDYSGAETATSSLKGLRVYMAGPQWPPTEVEPPPSPRKYWTRRGIAEWLVEILSQGKPTLVGIDHAFSFPIRYFEVHRIPPDWDAFLIDFQRHWPTDEDHTYVDFVRGRHLRQGMDSFWKHGVAQARRKAGRFGQIRLPFRRSGLCGQIHSRGPSLDSFLEEKSGRPRALLAL